MRVSRSLRPQPHPITEANGSGGSNYCSPDGLAVERCNSVEFGIAISADWNSTTLGRKVDDPMHKRTNKNPVKEILVKLQSVLRRAVAERGDFEIFGLFLREGAQDQWDLIVAAPWLEAGRGKSWAEISRRISAALTAQETTILYRTVVLDSSDEALDEMLRLIPKDYPPVEMSNFIFSGVAIQRGFILAAKGRAPVARRDGRIEAVLRETDTGRVDRFFPDSSGSVVIPKGDYQVI